ncbi:MAG: hypothetical protein DDT27_01455 [Dehalococcoidia bacterium]|nr:hypothetical protein [Chloroflexota bacterium]MBT9160975.1 hypothetical protein [Chloroflexota bacterium]MBT9162890.1 hypothetical protein [Chloroflexota bacterium]
MIDDLIRSNRSFRRFDQGVTLSRDTLVDLVDLARHSASTRNLQPLKYILSCEPERNDLIFATLTWGAALKDWGGPAEGERPSAYIIVLGDTKLTANFGCDHGIASQSIMLGAKARDLGGCMIASIDRPRLRASLNIPDRYEILLVLAIGKPAETVVIEPLGPEGDTRYWRDSQGIHHVPKRSLDEIILSNG